MSDLADFLLARIAEDEAMAQAATGKPVEISGAEVLAHISRWTSRRVLAECAAKRRIVADYAEAGAQGHPMYDAAADYMEGAVMALARVYAEHPNYRQEWKP